VPVSGTRSCAAGDPVELTSTAALFPPDGFGLQVARDAAGNFHTTYTIPTATPPGTYSIGLRCGGGNVGVSVPLQVTQPSTTTSAAGTSSVPTATTNAPPLGRQHKSSSSTGWILLGALVVLIAVGVAVFFFRRGRATAPRL